MYMYACRADHKFRDGSIFFLSCVREWVRFQQRWLALERQINQNKDQHSCIHTHTYTPCGWLLHRETSMYNTEHTDTYTYTHIHTNTPCSLLLRMDSCTCSSATWYTKCRLFKKIDNTRITLNKEARRALRSTANYTATQCNTVQHHIRSTSDHTATQCNTVQHSATQCNTLQ